VASVPTLSRIRLTCTPCAAWRGQRLHEALADLVVVQDVGFQVDVVARAGDGREHGR
jgi:hypothetical protein